MVKVVKLTDWVVVVGVLKLPDKVVVGVVKHSDWVVVINIMKFLYYVVADIALKL